MSSPGPGSGGAPKGGGREGKAEESPRALEQEGKNGASKAPLEGENSDGMGSVFPSSQDLVSQDLFDAQTMGQDSQVLPPSRFRKGKGRKTRKKARGERSRDERGFDLCGQELAMSDDSSSGDNFYRELLFRKKAASSGRSSPAPVAQTRQTHAVPANPHEDDFLLPMEVSRELILHKGFPSCFGQDHPTPQTTYTEAQPCNWPTDRSKYTTAPQRAIIATGEKLTGSVRGCCGKLHFDDITMMLEYRNQVRVPVKLSHTAITRLLRVEAEDYFNAKAASEKRPINAH